ncbi:MAG: TusE/DsrC/DsvC family sulfur relay protein [Pseudomonadales bacterium]|nr:TusE/DsrC/DsvC family sulfur relay protein [Pseudomonadales bacterium]
MLNVDAEGYLLDRSDWTESVARELAAREGLSLTAQHWDLIILVRDFYARFEVSPAMRPLVKQIRERLGDDKANSIYLLTLFPGSPAKLLAKIAGLPRPTNCL